MEEDLREKAYRVVAYSSIGFSIIAVLSVSITLPMVYNYVDHIQTQMSNDVGFCRVAPSRFSEAIDRIDSGLFLGIRNRHLAGIGGDTDISDNGDKSNGEAGELSTTAAAVSGSRASALTTAVRSAPDTAVCSTSASNTSSVSALLHTRSARPSRSSGQEWR